MNNSNVLADKPLVSVIMAAFNAANFIAEAIESVLGQSYENWELIIVNDGSTDNTDFVIQKYLANHKVKYITQKNSGQTRAKNNGIKNSSGKIIGFCDADDYWHPQKLRMQLEILLADSRTGIVYSDIQSINQYGEKIKAGEVLHGKSGYLLEDLLFDNFIPFGSAIFKTECIEEHGGFNEAYRMGIDWDLWLRFSTTWKFGFSPEKLYFYREWEGQMSRNYNGRYMGALTILENFKVQYPNVAGKTTYRKAISDIYANYAYHISLYEGYNWRLLSYSIKALTKGYDRLDTVKRVIRAVLRRF
jgi:glycosyltransferase involved in cell wall biosynthesis